MKYAKTIVVSLGAILTVCTAAFADDLLSMDETGTIISVVIVQGLTIWGVFQKRNKGYGITDAEKAEIFRDGWRAGAHQNNLPQKAGE